MRPISGRGSLKRFKLPDARYFTQVFCDLCGSKMPLLDPERGLAVVPFGILDDDPGTKPMDHIFAVSKAAWHDITDDLPVFKEGPGSQRFTIDEQT